MNLRDCYLRNKFVELDNHYRLSSINDLDLNLFTLIGAKSVKGIVYKVYNKNSLSISTIINKEGLIYVRIL